MKIVFISFLVISILLFSGCSSSQTTKETTNEQKYSTVGLSKPFESSANIEYGDINAQIVFKKTNASAEVTFLSPKSIENMTLILKNEEIKISYHEINFVFNPKLLPETAVANIIVATLNAAASDNVTFSLNDGILEVKGTIENGEFILKLDNENGKVLKLLVPSEDFKMEFVNFTFLS